MPIMQFANGLLQTVSQNAQTATDTTFTPVSPGGLPTTPQFTLLNIRTSELVLVTALGVTWTITRAYGGSAGAPFQAGDVLQYSVTREMLLGGMVVKLDEVGPLSALAPGMVLNVPANVAPRGLQVWWNARSGDQTIAMVMRIRLNNDSTSTYYRLSGYSSNGSANGSAENLVGWAFVGNMANNNAAAGVASAGVVEIPNASQATFRKTLIYRHVTDTGNGTPNDDYGTITFPQVPAITQVTMLPNAGNFAVGSVATLYGVP